MMRRDESTGPGEQGTERVALYVLTTGQRVWIVLSLPGSFSLAPKQLLLFFYSSNILIFFYSSAMERAIVQLSLMYLVRSS